MRLLKYHCRVGKEKKIQIKWAHSTKQIPWRFDFSWITALIQWVNGWIYQVDTPEQWISMKSPEALTLIWHSISFDSSIDAINHKQLEERKVLPMEIHNDQTGKSGKGNFKNMLKRNAKEKKSKEIQSEGKSSDSLKCVHCIRWSFEFVFSGYPYLLW